MKTKDEASVGGGGIVQFGRDAWAELKKVHRPTRQETFAATVGVFAMIVFFAVLLGVVDLAVGRVMRWVLAWG